MYFILGLHPLHPHPLHPHPCKPKPKPNLAILQTQSRLSPLATSACAANGLFSPASVRVCVRLYVYVYRATIAVPCS